jgi:hypothetical protein
VDVFERILEDHEEMRAMLDDMEQQAERDVEVSLAAFSGLCAELGAHHETEEHLLFCRLVENDGARPVAEEAWEEHVAIESYLEKVKQDPGGERWKAKAEVLKELVEHHLQEEERELFAKARDVLPAAELTRLGEEFDREMKRRLSKSPG